MEGPGRGRRQALGRVPADARLRGRPGGESGARSTPRDVAPHSGARSTWRCRTTSRGASLRRGGAGKTRRAYPLLARRPAVPPHHGGRRPEPRARAHRRPVTSRPQFVLIHGGMPLVEHAAYLALKPHVWYDMSAMPFLYPVPEPGRRHPQGADVRAGEAALRHRRQSRRSSSGPRPAARGPVQRGARGAVAGIGRARARRRRGLRDGGAHGGERAAGNASGSTGGRRDKRRRERSTACRR